MAGAMDLTTEVDRDRRRRLRRDRHLRRVVHHRRRDRGRDRVPGVRADRRAEAAEGDRGRAEEVRRDLGRRTSAAARGVPRPCGSPTRTAGSTCSRSGSRAPRSRPCRACPTRSSSWWSRGASSGTPRWRSSRRRSARSRGPSGRRRRRCSPTSARAGWAPRPRTSRSGAATCDIVELTPERARGSIRPLSG